MTNTTSAVATPDQAAQCDTKALSRMPFCGPPPLLRGENAMAYDELLARVSGELKPKDVFEEIWTREIGDLIWENMRWRRDLALFLDTIFLAELEAVLTPLLANAPSQTASGKSFVGRINAAAERRLLEPELVRGWMAGDAVAVERVQSVLASAHLTIDHVVAKAAARHLDKVEAFNRLVANTAYRRDALLREIERRRDFAQRARRELEKIEDADFETVLNNSAQSSTSRGTTVANDSTTAEPAEVNAAEAGADGTKPVARKPVEDQSVEDLTIEVDPLNAKPAHAKLIEVRSIDLKPGEAKPGDAKPIDVNVVATNADAHGSSADRSMEDNLVAVSLNPRGPLAPPEGGMPS